MESGESLKKGKPGAKAPGGKGKKMWEIVMEIDGQEYTYGKYSDRTKANEIAMQVRDERGVSVSVYEVS